MVVLRIWQLTLTVSRGIAQSFLQRRRPVDDDVEWRFVGIAGSQNQERLSVGCHIVLMVAAGDRRAAT